VCLDHGDVAEGPGRAAPTWCATCGAETATADPLRSSERPAFNPTCSNSIRWGSFVITTCQTSTPLPYEGVSQQLLRGKTNLWAPSSRPPDCPSKCILDGDGWAFGWTWMGPQSPSKRVRDGIAMGIWMGVSRRWRSPNSGLECAESRGPPEEQRVIFGRLGRFIFRNLILRPCDHTIGAPRASSVRSGQFSSS